MTLRLWNNSNNITWHENHEITAFNPLRFLCLRYFIQTISSSSFILTTIITLLNYSSIYLLCSCVHKVYKHTKAYRSNYNSRWGFHLFLICNFCVIMHTHCTRWFKIYKWYGISLIIPVVNSFIILNHGICAATKISSCFI